MNYGVYLDKVLYLRMCWAVTRSRPAKQAST